MSLEPPSGVDWIALIIVAWMIVLGFVRGFVRELVRLCAWIGGLWLGRRYEGQLAPFLKRHVAGLETPFDSFVAYALIAAAVVVVCALVLRMFQSGVRRLDLQSYDRLLGAAIGAAKGVLVVTIAVLALAHLPGFEAARKQVENTQTARLANLVVKKIQPLFPRSLQAELDAFAVPR